MYICCLLCPILRTICNIFRRLLDLERHTLDRVSGCRGLLHACSKFLCRCGNVLDIAVQRNHIRLDRIDDLPDYITLIFHFSDKISDLALHILKALAENTKVVPAVLKLYRQRLRKITLCNITDVRECNLK